MALALLAPELADALGELGSLHLGAGVQTAAANTETCLAEAHVCLSALTLCGYIYYVFMMSVFLLVNLIPSQNSLLLGSWPL